MSIFTWIIFGAVVGIIANVLDPKQQEGGLPAAVILGIVGATIGGFLGSVVLNTGITGFNFISLFIAVVGALLVLTVKRAF